MRDGLKGNPEEGLRRALAEFADETSLVTASARVHATLRREVRVKAGRRRMVMGLVVSLAAAAALAAVIFGITLRPARPVAPAIAQAQHALDVAAQPAPAPAVEPVPARTVETTARPARTRRGTMRSSSPLAASAKRGANAPAADWRKGEMVLSPWYFNTALPPAARSVLVRSEVDARTALRFGVVPAGDTAPVEILFGEDGLPRAMRFVRHLPTQKN